MYSPPGLSIPAGLGAKSPFSQSSVATEATAKGDLLYVIGSEALYVLTYPGGKLLKKAQGSGGSGICSDTSGNVFVTVGSKILEYPHGATTPTTVLQDPGQLTIDCSFDPVTGNLAVTNATLRSSPGSVAVYLSARGNPVIYSDPQIALFGFCGYDNKGNLFVNGENSSGAFELAELPSGGSSLQSLTVNKRVIWGVLQWDGDHITLENQPPFKGAIYQLAVSGSKATVVGTTKMVRWSVHPEVLSWIYGDTVIAPDSPRARKIGLWPYPVGGRPRMILAGFSGKDLLRGETVSVSRK
jgi:hypothetical protein